MTSLQFAIHFRTKALPLQKDSADSCSCPVDCLTLASMPGLSQRLPGSHHHLPL
uniref:Uncharacterized protein n=1 Tax=Arundo donax TaxID=35708 RepID=A0A0A9HYB5_ARUDO